MAKSKLVDSLGGRLLPEPTECKSVPTVKSARPVGSMILVEVFTPKELMNTSIDISDKTDVKVPLQGYVRAVGPGFKAADWGYDVGSRVMLSTANAVMAPKYDDCHRDRFFMEPHSIKAVLGE